MKHHHHILTLSSVLIAGLGMAYMSTITGFAVASEGLKAGIAAQLILAMGLTLGLLILFESRRHEH